MSEAERAGASRQDNNGRLLAGRYRLGDVLGRGGMGTVWRAEDETLGRTVAVKELRFPSNIDEDEKRRLITRTLREAKAIARIRNNSAVTVFDVVDEDDRPWIVMELVEGKSLAEVIREDGLLEPRRAAEVGLAVLDVLRSAHREGILHRDVKPSNVLIAEDGRVVLTDFGIAQVEGDPSITSTGMLVGAPSYISPERARGHKPGPAADLWSLGGLLYASVEGVPPYDKGSAIATLTAVMTEPLGDPKNAGPLKDVIYGLLTKDPANRLDDAAARSMLTDVIHAPEPKEAEAPDATKVVPLPAQPDAPAEAGERLRGALRSVRKAAVAAGAGAAAAASSARAKSGGSGEAAAGSGSGSGSESGSASGGAAAGNGPSGGRSSGWPVMTPPDLPPRPVPRAPLTDVVPRRTLVIIAVVVLLAVIGTVLTIVFSGGDSKDSASGGGKASTKASAGADTKGDEGGGTHPDGQATASAGAGAGQTSGAEPSADASASSDSGSNGGDGSSGGAASTHQGSQGYSIGLPKGWKYVSSGAAGDRFTGPNGQKLLIGWTTTPKDDPVADWKNQEGAMQRAQYQRIRIEAVNYRGWNTADWEFTYVEGGTKYRSIDRGFVVDDDLGYGLMYTAKAANWGSELRKDTWRTLTKSFEPKA
ncbi:serine/threonine protein kinase [Streptomyces davaonensis JCM 4913]|uniref:non-specific serine/threonine protein kinase n=1 Tax=Streptomyces davaonensis (strain DSM 101723 / JCM 4913 / KCC S-0913 / 768) TaxID=1214101 RepID=K4R3U4_STRDJ|nr:serine/threonine-protein kinase [Streptomyces davaonensis]CCK28023.1 serine/threonine protein kinase [Streptomyces davaonensis JCM 4913]